MSSVGESVARDRLARLSMMRLTHSIWTADRGDVPSANEPPQAVSTATMFTTSCKTQSSHQLQELTMLASNAAGSACSSC